LKANSQAYMTRTKLTVMKVCKYTQSSNYSAKTKG